MRLLLLLLTACQSPSPLDTASEERFSALRAEVQAFHERADGTFTAELPGVGLSAELSLGGLALQDADGGALHLRLAAAGRDELETLSSGPPRWGDCTQQRDPRGECLRMVELDYGALTERWESFGDGLAQSWELSREPEGDGPLTLSLETDGARVYAEGEDLAIEARDGSEWSYGALFAYDADGEPLPATLEPDGERILIQVDLTGARYPVLIDPVLTTASSSLSPSTANVQFGFAVAGVGDVNGDGYDDVVVGAPAINTYAGAAYVYSGSAGPGSQGGVSTTATTTLAPSSLTTYSYFGAAIAGAGDVNGDGYDDVIVGAYSYNGASGRVYVFHGSATGLSTSPASTINGPAANSAFGGAVAGGGDINGDGYDDVVVGAYGYSSNAGRVLVYLGSTSGLVTTAATTLNGAASSYFGRSVASLGDVNGDGYDDIAVGAYRASNVGQVTVYHGSASGLTSTASTTLTGPSTNAQFGYSIDRAGDVNDDGYADLVVGAYGANSYVGQVTLYHGSAGSGSGGGIRTTAASTLNGTSSGDYFGATVSGAGDVDLDGYDDVLVGAYGASSLTGAAYVYLGSSSGVVSAVDTTLTGSASNSSFAQALDGAGDVNGDGFADLILGAPGQSSNSGAATVFHGYSDHDSDGVIGAEDCDDFDASVGGPALAYNDGDGDGYGDPLSSGSACIGGSWVANAEDCDDTDPAVHPGTVERVGDEVDQNCDGSELCYTDADGDGARTTDLLVSSDTDCADAGEAPGSVSAGDCDDSNSNILPGATEIAGDGVDQDCDGAELCYLDSDDDGYRVDQTALSANTGCDGAGEALLGSPDGDCADSDPAIHPDAEEGVGDGIDQDCDGREICLSDLDSDGFRTDIQRDSSDEDCLDPGEALASQAAGDCDDSDSDINPDAFELVGDGVDANCDGVEDCYADADQDGWRSGTVQASEDLDCDDPGEREDDGRPADCDDSDPLVHPEAEELTGDLIDSDCDGREICYLDADGDGHRTEATIVSADVDCDDVAEGAVALPADDCDDFDADVFPGATEIKGDGEDQDCDGVDTPADEPVDTGTPSDDKGCSSAPSQPGGWLILSAFMALKRRSRRTV